MSACKLTVLVETIIGTVLINETTHHVLIIFDSSVLSKWRPRRRNLVQTVALNSYLIRLLSWSCVSFCFWDLLAGALGPHAQVAPIQISTDLLLYVSDASWCSANNGWLPQTVDV